MQIRCSFSFPQTPAFDPSAPCCPSSRQWRRASRCSGGDEGKTRTIWGELPQRRAISRCSVSVKRSEPAEFCTADPCYHGRNLLPPLNSLLGVAFEGG